jgi:hypothetical protein
MRYSYSTNLMKSTEFMKDALLQLREIDKLE